MRFRLIALAMVLLAAGCSETRGETKDRQSGATDGAVETVAEISAKWFEAENYADYLAAIDVFANDLSQDQKRQVHIAIHRVSSGFYDDNIQVACGSFEGLYYASRYVDDFAADAEGNQAIEWLQKAKTNIGQSAITPSQLNDPHFWLEQFDYCKTMLTEMRVNSMEKLEPGYVKVIERARDELAQLDEQVENLKRSKVESLTVDFTADNDGESYSIDLFTNTRQVGEVSFDTFVELRDKCERSVERLESELSDNKRFRQEMKDGIIPITESMWRGKDRRTDALPSESCPTVILR